MPSLAHALANPDFSSSFETLLVTRGLRFAWAVFIAVDVRLPFVISIAGGKEMAEAVAAEHPRFLLGLNIGAAANAALTGWRTVSGNEDLELSIA